MIATIIIVGFALAWLEWETDCFTVRLPVGSNLVINKPPGGVANDIVTPILALPEFCELTRIQREFAKTKYHYSWRYGTSYNTRRKESYQAMTIGNHKITLCATLGNLYDLIAEAQKIQTEKPRKPTIRTTPLPTFIEQVRVGSHQEWVETDDKGHGYHRIVEEYDTRYKDCLVSISWLKKHEHDEYPEPNLDISVDGELKSSINGNYKKGSIADVLKPYTTKARIGRKIAVLNVGEADRQ